MGKPLELTTRNRNAPALVGKIFVPVVKMAWRLVEFVYNNVFHVLFNQEVHYFYIPARQVGGNSLNIPSVHFYQGNDCLTLHNPVAAATFCFTVRYKYFSPRRGRLHSEWSTSKILPCARSLFDSWYQWIHPPNSLRFSTPTSVERLTYIANWGRLYNLFSGLLHSGNESP